jgi:hypothetical protein
MAFRLERFRFGGWTPEQQQLSVYERFLRSLRPIHVRSVLVCALLVSGASLPRRMASASFSTGKRGRRHAACTNAHGCGVSRTGRTDGNILTLRRLRRRPHGWRAALSFTRAKLISEAIVVLLTIRGADARLLSHSTPQNNATPKE